MICSMTGFGKSSNETDKGKVTVEIRSLNGKTTDIRLKYPAGYSEKEMWIRNFIHNKLTRGKFDVNISNNMSNGNNLSVNENLFKEYHKKLNKLADELNEKNRDFFPSIVRIPNIFKETEYELSEEEWRMTITTLEEAADKLMQYRKQEGVSIKKDIVENITRIKNSLPSIIDHDIERKKIIKDRLSKSIAEIEDRNKVDKNRFEQEVMYYLEKLDINEEQQRLKQHCDYFLEIINDESKFEKGKKLNFIAQEIGREINTMGAKAQYSPLQKLVVNMKDNLEKIKEQLANVL